MVAIRINNSPIYEYVLKWYTYKIKSILDINEPNELIIVRY